MSLAQPRTFHSYPRPEDPISLIPTVPPVPTLPYLAPPGPPPHPLPLRPPLPLPLPSGWVRREYAVPAAFPRRYTDSFGDLARESTPQRVPGQNAVSGLEESKEQRTARNEGEVREMLIRRYERREGMTGAEKGLWMAAERWTRVEGRGGDVGITLVMTHANGFHKEMWHPTLTRLLAQPLPSAPQTSFGHPALTDSGSFSTSPTSTSASRDSSIEIDEIWLFDDIHHGASIDLNAGRIGPVHGWSDGGRDIVNFLLHVWKGDASATYPNEALDWISDNGNQKGDGGKKRRKVVGIGHSFGGNALVQAASERPDLFHALFLVDPMCPSWAPSKFGLDLLSTIRKTWSLVLGAIKRRTSWPSIEAAEDAMRIKGSSFFGKWDPDVWAVFRSHGLVPLLKDGSDAAAGHAVVAGENAQQGGAGFVQLATPSWAEAAVFAEPTGLAEGWDRLPTIPPSVPVGFLMANEPRATMGEKMTREMVWRAQRCANELVPDAGHLIVQEKPQRVADALSRFLGSLAPELAEGVNESRDTRVDLGARPAQAKL